MLVKKVALSLLCVVSYTMFQTCLVRCTSNIVVCLVSPVGQCVVGLTLWRGHTPDKAQSWHYHRQDVRNSEACSSSSSSSGICESSSAPEKLAPPSHTSHSYKPRPILYPAGRDSLVVVTRHTAGYMQDSPAQSKHNSNPSSVQKLRLSLSGCQRQLAVLMTSNYAIAVLAPNSTCDDVLLVLPQVHAVI